MILPAQLGSGGVGTQARQQLETNVLFYAHGPGVDLQNVRSSTEIWQSELQDEWVRVKGIKYD